HDRARVCGESDAAEAGDVRAAESSSGSCTGGFWRGRRLHWRQEGSLSLFLHGPAALGRLFRQGLSGRDRRSLLGWPCGGVCFLRRRAAIDSLRQYQTGGRQDRERGQVAALEDVRGAAESLPF